MRSSLLRSQNLPRGKSVKSVCGHRYSGIVKQLVVGSVVLWDADLIILWMLKHRTIHKRIIDLFCFAKRRWICSLRNDISCKDRKVGTAHLTLGLGKAEVMWVMKCLILCCFVFLAAVLIAAGDRKKLKKEKEEAGYEHWQLVGFLLCMWAGGRYTSLWTSQQSPVSCLWLWALTHSAPLVGCQTNGDTLNPDPCDGQWG